MISIILNKLRYVKYFTAAGYCYAPPGTLDSWFGTLVLGNSEFVLGYENNKSCQTYKILRYSWDRCGLERQLVDCGIYDFESHSWRDLNDGVPKKCTIVSKAVSLKGNIYWIAEKEYEEDFLLSFDFSTEKFRCLCYKSLRGWPITNDHEAGSSDWNAPVEGSSVMPSSGGVSCVVLFFLSTVSIFSHLGFLVFLERNNSPFFYNSLSIPFPSIDAYCVPTALAVVREERLSVLYCSVFDPPKIEIWMATHDKIDQTKDFSWNKFLSVELDDNNPHHKRFSSSATFFIDEKKKTAVLCDLEYIHKWNRDMVYIFGEDNGFMKIPVGEYKWLIMRSLVYNYVPSLVQIQ
uniref:F-box associated beta-propeller type 1 domain-containing protein n=1 Tax=Brassica oleracea TaxID=3712 RepID=A0A3P6BUR3_BRAOL|nr:unnamed protein product [Brassica oleracea]